MAATRECPKCKKEIPNKVISKCPSCGKWLIGTGRKRVLYAVIFLLTLGIVQSCVIKMLEQF